jgi:3-isopropylmalate dehydrogenase
MGNLTQFRIAVLPGDGIGHDILPSCLEVLNAAAARTGAFTLDCESREAGADCYRGTGHALPAEALRAARSADAILLGAMGLPSICYPDGTEIMAQIGGHYEIRA